MLSLRANSILFSVATCVLISLVFHGCVYYPPVTPPVRSSEFYDYRSTKEGITVACHPYATEAESRLAFGADVLAAQILPVEILVFNGSSKDLNLSAVSLRLKDAHGQELEEVSPQEANVKVKKLTGKTLAAWATAGTLMLFFTLPSKLKREEGPAAHLDPVKSIKKARTAVLEAGDKPVSLLPKENVRWFTYFDISQSRRDEKARLFSKDLFAEVTGIYDSKSQNEHRFTVYIPLSEKM